MDSYLVKWNTGRLIKAELDKLSFFHGYKSVHPELHDIYTALVKYSEGYNNVSANHRNNFGHNADSYDPWVAHLDKMLEFQLFVTSREDNAEAGEIATRAKGLFGNKDVAEAYCADLHVLDQLNMLVEYSESVRHLFNYIVPLTKHGENLTTETEQEIRLILEAKGLGDFKVPEELLITNN
tara:strand:- start:651 stop:1193 length:543 start_codon:yes stop_codon:yes gene_type:complete